MLGMIYLVYICLCCSPSAQNQDIQAPYIPKLNKKHQLQLSRVHKEMFPLIVGADHAAPWKGRHGRKDEATKGGKSGKSPYQLGSSKKSA